MRPEQNATTTDIVSDFIGAMEVAGIRPVEPIAGRLISGQLIRFRCEGDKPGKRNAWAVLYLDNRPAGAFGCYRLQIGRQLWRANDLRELSPAERASMQREWAAARDRRDRDRREGWRLAASDANAAWTRCSPASPDHPYLKRKGLPGDFTGQEGDRLVVPMFDMNGRIWNLQRIAPNGFKLFAKGGRTEGLFWIAGSVGETLCIGEGVATMAAVRLATGHAVAAAFSAENLLAVARMWREARPHLDIVICGDDDEHLVDHPQVGRNLGRDAAEHAARAIRARVAFPPRAA